MGILFDVLDELPPDVVEDLDPSTEMNSETKQIANSRLNMGCQRARVRNVLP